MTKNEKEFDAVVMMRQIRDKLYIETKGMSFEEQQRYIKEQLSPRAAKTTTAVENTKEAA